MFELLCGEVAPQRLHPLGVVVVVGDYVKNLHLVVGGLLVVGGALLDFEGHVGVVLEVPREPDSREVAPAQFLNNYIPLTQELPYVHWVVPPHLVVGYALVLTLVRICKPIQG